MTDRASSRDDLRSLLRRYNERPDERDGVLDEIDRRFRKRLAILVLDTCGFSRTVESRGIVYFLAALERLERVIRPAVERAGGRVLRREADNVFATFTDSTSALSACRSILDEVRAANEALPKEDEIDVSIGIGYGDLLMVGEDDVWGEEMNLASKLGEDVAGPGEVLLTPAAREGLAEDVPLDEVPVNISGLSLTGFRLEL